LHLDVRLFLSPKPTAKIIRHYCFKKQHSVWKKATNNNYRQKLKPQREFSVFLGQRLEMISMLRMT